MTGISFGSREAHGAGIRMGVEYADDGGANIFDLGEGTFTGEGMIGKFVIPGASRPAEDGIEDDVSAA
jgi:hypothetical protein